MNQIKKLHDFCKHKSEVVKITFFGLSMGHQFWTMQLRVFFLNLILEELQTRLKRKHKIDRINQILTSLQYLALLHLPSNFGFIFCFIRCCFFSTYHYRKKLPLNFYIYIEILVSLLLDSSLTFHFQFHLVNCLLHKPLRP